MSEQSPRYLKCACQHCNDHFEFDDSLLAPGEVLAILCPHCKVETTISRSDPFAESAATAMSQLIAPCGPNERTDVVTLAMKGAVRSDPMSMQILGFAYYLGFALKADHTEAVKWIYRAAAGGNASAQFNLGCMYHWGTAVEKDPSQAFAWWLKAAEQGHVIAQNNVGYSYDIGEVVQRDYVEAYKWMSLAASQGHPAAQEHCNELAAKMTAEQREESYRRIEEFENIQAEQPELTPGWWDKVMTERQGNAERYLAALQLAQREPNYERRQISSQVRQQVWIRDGAKCKKCGSRELLHLDHIIPVSKGGSDALENLELLCQSCNLAKGAKIQ